jgi:formiminoglutamase
MNGLNFIDPQYIDQITVKRHGEPRLGEALSLITSPEELAASKVRYLIVGIPEDLGVSANGGRRGAAKTWEAFLTHFCSLALAKNNLVNNVAILGSINCQDLMDQGKTLNGQNPQDQKTFDQLITRLDHRVETVIQPLISAGFIPVVIGGGHNNALGLLKASSKALSQAMNCLNIDAHTDLRPDDYRHSGNGFHRALIEKHLGRYGIFGLHEHTLSPGITNFIQHVNFEKQKPSNEQNKQIDYLSLNEWLDTPVAQRHNRLKQWIEPIIQNHFGLEIDLDVIADMGSSAQSPVGFSLEEVRLAARAIAGHHNLRYIHLCEGAPELGLYPGQVVKTLSALCFDLIV